MHDVFLSYARSDGARARRFAAWLQAQGWSVHWDQTIPPGDRWDEAIARGLDEAACVIVLWSRDSVQSDWVKTEAAEANRRKVLIPVLIDAVEIPLEFRRIQALDLSDWNFDDETAGTALLRQAVTPFLDPARQAPPPRTPAPRQRRRIVTAALSAAAVALAVVAAIVLKDGPRKPAAELVALSASLLKQVRQKEDDSKLFWPYMLEEEGGRLLLEQSVLLALEAIRREPGHPEARTTLRKVLALLPRPLRAFAHDDQVEGVAISPDGKRLATASRDGSAGLWDIGGALVARLRHTDAVQNVVFSPDGQWLATSSRDGTTRVWDASNGRPIASLAHPDSGSFGIQHVRFTPDGKRLVTLENRVAHLWSLPDGREVRVFRHPHHLGKAVVSRDGAYLVVAGSGADVAPVTVWNLETGVQAALLQDKEARPIGGLAIGTDIVAIAEPDLVLFWRVGTWTRIGELRVKAYPSTAALSPDGSSIAIGGGSARYGPVVLGPVGEGSAVGSIVSQRKNSGVYAVRYSADGKLVVAVAQDRTAQVLDAATGEERLRVITGPDVHLAPNPAAISPDGRYVVTAGLNEARLWDIVPADLVAEACRSVGRNLTTEEWRDFLGGEAYRKTCPERR